MNLLSIWTLCGPKKITANCRSICISDCCLSFHLCLFVNLSANLSQNLLVIFFLIFWINLEDNKYKSWQHWIFLEKGKWPKITPKYILKVFWKNFFMPLPEAVNCGMLFSWANLMSGKVLFWNVLKGYQPIWLKNPSNISVSWIAGCISMIVVNIPIDNRNVQKFRIPY